LGHGLIDRELYVPEEWCRDAARRLSAHIPASLPFRTKPELAKQMVERAQAAGLPIGWVVADTVYGHSTDLRLWLEEQGYAYAASHSQHRGHLCPDPAGLPAQLGRPHRPAGP